MPASNGNSTAAAPASKPRRVPIVPAIPLALSKPKIKSVRPKPDAVVDSKVEETSSNIAAKSTSVATDGDVLPTATSEVRGEGEEQQESQFQQLPNGHSDNGSAHGVSYGDTQIPQSSAATSPPVGAVPDLTPNEAVVQRTAPSDSQDEASSVTTTASPLSVRKERFDIRHIRTELPPAFVPSAEQHTPQSAQSAASSQTRPPQQLPQNHQQHVPHPHPVHASTSSIVFGGNDSAASSPAPPHSAGSGYAPPQYPLSGAYPVHNYHTSDSHTQRSHQPVYPQQSVPWAGRHHSTAGAQQHYHPHAHMPFRFPHREPFTTSTPLNNVPDLRSRSRSGSHASSAAHDLHRSGNDLQLSAGFEQPDSGRSLYTDQRAAAFPTQHRQFASQQMPPQPSAFSHPDIATALENAETMRDHVLSQWLNPEMSDCRLQVIATDDDVHTYVEGHKIILARSPILSAMIRNSESSDAAANKTQVDVRLEGRYIRAGHFSESLRYLYGGPLPRLDFYRSLENNEDRMTFALGFIATGAWLRIAPVAHRGVELAGSLLQWDCYSTALAFALAGGLGQAWPIEEGSEERISTCSSDDSIGKPEAGGSPTYDPYSTGLLHRIIDFTVQNFPPNFYVDSAAPQLPSCPRLPASRLQHQSRQSRSDPRLSKIRFGEVPADDHQRPSVITTAISSIMLSLPFPLLKFLLEHPLLSNRLGPETVASIMRQVVHEREVRRRKVLTAWSVSNDDTESEPQQIQNLYWEESVEQSAQHRAGSRLARRRRGIDTPPGSGIESEQVRNVS